MWMWMWVWLIVLMIYEYGILPRPRLCLANVTVHGSGSPDINHLDIVGFFHSLFSTSLFAAEGIKRFQGSFWLRLWRASWLRQADKQKSRKAEKLTCGPIDANL